MLWRHANNMYITCAMRTKQKGASTSAAAAAPASLMKPCLHKLHTCTITCSAQEQRTISENVCAMCENPSYSLIVDIEELAAIFFHGDLMVTSSLDIASRSSQINMSFPADSLW